MTSELDARARALVGLALKGEQRLPRDRDRVRRGVLAVAAAPAALGTAEAAAAGKAAVGATAAGTKMTFFSALGVLKAAPLVAVGVAASIVGMKAAPVTRHETATAVASASKAQAKAAPIATGVASVDVPAQLDGPAPASTPVETNRAAAVGHTETPVPPSLAADLEALQRAQRTLNAGNAAGALLELRAVRGHTLRAERTALEVFAQCALGNVALARRQAALFRRLAPHSPLLARVEASCVAK